MSFWIAGGAMRRMAAAVSALLMLPVAAAGEVNLYTDRQEVFLRDVVAAYEKDSGDEVNILFVKKGLLERARAEGDTSPADVYLAADVGVITDFVAAGLTAPSDDSELNVISPSLRDPGRHWFAVTRRVRIGYAAPGVSIGGYDEWADPKWRDSICSRSGHKSYNIGLFAHIIGTRGEAKAKTWLEAVKKNLARKPSGNDRTQIKAVARGECKIGIANSYYYFHLLNSEKEGGRLRMKVVPVFPDNPHINITAMSLAHNAPHPKAAARLMQFLLSKQAQAMLAEKNFEFPARNDVEWPEILQPYKDAVQNARPQLAATAQYRRAASRMVDDVGFDR